MKVFGCEARRKIDRRGGVHQRAEVGDKDKELSQIGKRKRFEFRTRGKIIAEESTELRRTHHNIFDWVKKQRTVVEEKDIFEKGEELEIEIEPMEIDVMSKEERLSRMSSRMKAWEAGVVGGDGESCGEENDRRIDRRNNQQCCRLW